MLLSAFFTLAGGIDRWFPPSSPNNYCNARASTLLNLSVFDMDRLFIAYSSIPSYAPSYASSYVPPVPSCEHRADCIDLMIGNVTVFLTDGADVTSQLSKDCSAGCIGWSRYDQDRVARASFANAPWMLIVPVLYAAVFSHSVPALVICVFMSSISIIVSNALAFGGFGVESLYDAGMASFVPLLVLGSALDESFMHHMRGGRIATLLATLSTCFVFGSLSLHPDSSPAMREFGIVCGLAFAVLSVMRIFRLCMIRCPSKSDVNDSSRSGGNSFVAVTAIWIFFLLCNLLSPPLWDFRMQDFVSIGSMPHRFFSAVEHLQLPIPFFVLSETWKARSIMLEYWTRNDAFLLSSQNSQNVTYDTYYMFGKFGEEGRWNTRHEEDHSVCSFLYDSSVLGGDACAFSPLCMGETIQSSLSSVMCINTLLCSMCCLAWCSKRGVLAAIFTIGSQIVFMFLLSCWRLWFIGRDGFGPMEWLSLALAPAFQMDYLAYAVCIRGNSGSVDMFHAAMTTCLAMIPALFSPAKAAQGFGQATCICILNSWIHYMLFRVCVGEWNAKEASTRAIDESSKQQASSYIPYDSVSNVYDIIARYSTLGFLSRARRLQRRRVFQQGDRVLFIGSGNGEDVNSCVKIGCNVTCIDCSSKMCDNLVIKYGSTVRVVCGDALECTRLEGETYDVVVANCIFNVLESEEMMERLAYKCASWLRIGGVVACVDFCDCTSSRMAHRIGAVAMHILTFGTQSANAQVPKLGKVMRRVGMMCLFEDTTSLLFSSFGFMKDKDATQLLEPILQCENLHNDMLTFAIVGNEERELHHVFVEEDSMRGLVSYYVVSGAWVAITSPMGMDACMRQRAHDKFVALANENGACAIYHTMHDNVLCELTLTNEARIKVGATHIKHLSEFEPSPSEKKTLRRLSKRFLFREENAAYNWKDYLQVRDGWVNGKPHPYLQFVTPRAAPHPRLVRAWVAREKLSGKCVSVCIGEVGGSCVTMTSYWEMPNIFGVKGVLDSCVYYALSTLSRSFRHRSSKVSRVSFGTFPLEDASPMVQSVASMLNYGFDGICKKKRQWMRHFKGGECVGIYAIACNGICCASLCMAVALITQSGWSLCSHVKRRKKRMLVVGAGYSGLLASDYFAKKEYDVFVVDDQSEVGGCWLDRANEWSTTESPASIYMRPFGARDNDKWTRSQMLNAFQDFSTLLRHRIRFNVQCTRRYRKGGDEAVTVVMQGVGSGCNDEFEADFDYIVFCTGTADRVTSTLDVLQSFSKVATACAEYAPIKATAATLHFPALSYVVIGGGSFATEAMDYLAAKGHNVTLVMRRRKVIFDASMIRWTLGVLFCPCLHSSIRRCLLGRHYMKSGMEHTLPSESSDLYSFHTTTSSKSMFARECVQVIVGTVQSVDKMGNVTIDTGENVQTIQADVIVDATGGGVDTHILCDLRDSLLLEERVGFLGDVVNGVGVWMIPAQLESLEKRLMSPRGYESACPTPMMHYPRQVSWFKNRLFQVAHTYNKRVAISLFIHAVWNWR